MRYEISANSNVVDTGSELICEAVNVGLTQGLYPTELLFEGIVFSSRQEQQNRAGEVYAMEYWNGPISFLVYL
jgi:hypothetical protein